MIRRSSRILTSPFSRIFGPVYRLTMPQFRPPSRTFLYVARPQEPIVPLHIVPPRRIVLVERFHILHSMPFGFYFRTRWTYVVDLIFHFLFLLDNIFIPSGKTNTLDMTRTTDQSCGLVSSIDNDEHYRTDTWVYILIYTLLYILTSRCVLV